MYPRVLGHKRRRDTKDTDTNFTTHIARIFGLHPINTKSSDLENPRALEIFTKTVLWEIGTEFAIGGPSNLVYNESGPW